MKTSTNTTMADRIDSVARAHGWERCHGAEHKFKKVDRGLVFRVEFSVRGNGLLVVEMFPAGMSPDRYDDIERRKFIGPLRPHSDESSLAYAERLFPTLESGVIVNELLSAAVDRVTAAERVVERARVRRDDVAAWAETWRVSAKSPSGTA